MKKIVTILGARPQFIKASVVSYEIAGIPSLCEVVVHTGQHFDENMSDIFFSELGMKPPDYFLDIHGGTHGVMTGRMLIEIERILLIEKPDLVLVYGDTNSTLAGALTAAKLHIPVAHIEAGLRSFNMKMPEEINRILTDRISKWLFCPNFVSSEHLRREGFDEAKIIPVGDVMFDVALHFGSRVSEQGGALNKFGLLPKKYILTTIHRAENTDNHKRLLVIVDALSEISKSIPVVWPIHPRTRAILDQLGLMDRVGKSLMLINPVGYLDMVQLEKYAALVATDSGGVQKEAFFYRVPCVTLRDETEWVELVESGWNLLAPPLNCKEIVDAILFCLVSRGKEISPYGNGKAAKLIVDKLNGDLYK
ncbi:UDP-N-acetylglucosamine 2-epimerase (non-hydrolyzing) [Polynucleobacter sp. MG-28-Ekke-A2]|uniref:non-hydrolyzing UDP-N-acetylglucosamine 2-epimerase n=1 Tax=Polynucleobacter sp. MG-28-Ekke-A2 TaxID=3108276 RepID=UPI002B23AEF0|nr:UDP-N-acetylglucosamine 2-epimerase (non-hydrolyzing) [Polynucleobacter sp. MG-28-Ekke-A2]MEA9601200.1 UDP-N-acetylglucosamine 2-epimerase (non-hydrolyzing) [Polynucleobacter sp. MG-28-Ekke-A2]